MATTDYENIYALAVENDSDDTESLASIDTDDGQDHPPEKILAAQSHNGFTWYLVKWQDCPIIRSSWEGISALTDFAFLFEEWEIEKTKQRNGISKPLDIVSFNTAVLEVELLERQRRNLRRLKRVVRRAISIVTD
jgi:hypothetical protein